MTAWVQCWSDCVVIQSQLAEALSRVAPRIPHLELANDAKIGRGCADGGRELAAIGECV